MSNPWDAFPYPERGDADLAETNKAVGAALSQWELLESVLAFLYSGIVRGGEESAIEALEATESFRSIQASRQRLNLLKAAGSEFFANRNRRQGDRFNELMILCENLAQRRNEIAHAHAVRVTTDGVDLGYFIQPGSHAAGLNTQTGPKYRYSSKELAHYAGQFANAKFLAGRLVMELNQKSRPMSGSSSG